MKIILDTNILIHIEDPKELSKSLQDLMKLFREHGHQIFIHPASLKDIDNDQDENRKKIILSKLKGYPLIGSPPQSIMELDQNQYVAIKKGGKLDERFTVS